MEGFAQQFCDTFIAEVRRRLFDECLVRVRICLNHLSEEEVWWRPNAQSNSAGNIVLHLCGNIRQWILSGLGKAADVRNRQLEFDECGPISKTELLSRLEAVLSEVDQVLAQVRPEQLLTIHQVQVYEESGISILTHVTEHFSYHVGQLTYLVKFRKNVDTAYYKEDLG